MSELLGVQFLDAVGRGWIAWVLAGVLPATALALVVLAVERLRPRMAPRLGIVLWALVLLRLAWPPGVEVVAGLAPPLALHEMTIGETSTEAPPPRAAGGARAAVEVAVEVEGGASQPAKSVAADRDSATRKLGWAAWLLLAHASLVAAWWATRGVRTRRLLARLDARGLPASDARCVVEWLGEAGLPVPRRLRVSPRAPSPLIVGALRPTIVLPEALLGSTSLRSAVVHEAVHCRRRDPLLLALIELLRAIFVINPAAWLAVRRVRALAELACDEAASRAVGDVHEYANALVDVSAGLRPAAASLGFAESLGRSPLARRVERILSPRRPSSPLRVAALVVGALTLSALSLPSAHSRPSRDGDTRTAERAVRIELPGRLVLMADSLLADPDGGARLAAAPGRSVRATVTLGEGGGEDSGRAVVAASAVDVRQGDDGGLDVRLAGPVSGRTGDGRLSVRADAATGSLRRLAGAAITEPADGLDARDLGRLAWTVDLSGRVAVDVEDLSVRADRARVTEAGEGGIAVRFEGGVQVSTPSHSLRCDSVEWRPGGVLRCLGGVRVTGSREPADSGSEILRRIELEGGEDVVFPSRDEGDGR